jgi:hypothetical protein
MSFKAVAVNVMIASPSDVAAERQNIRDIIHGWNATHAKDRHVVLLPLGWESHASPLMGDRAQAIINKQVLEECDLLVAVFWARLGSPTGEAASGTVEEINKHVSKSKPTMIYFSDAPVRLDSVEEGQYRALRAFREECKQRGLVETFSSIAEFREKFSRQLTQTILREFKDPAPPAEGGVWQIAQEDEIPPLSSEAQELLLECSQDQGGIVMRISTIGGLLVQTNGKNLVERGDPRSEARWRAAVDELVAQELLERRGYKDEVFGMTNTGYEVADILRRQG